MQQRWNTPHLFTQVFSSLGPWLQHWPQKQETETPFLWISSSIVSTAVISSAACQMHIWVYNLGKIRKSSGVFTPKMLCVLCFHRVKWNLTIITKHKIVPWLWYIPLNKPKLFLSISVSSSGRAMRSFEDLELWVLDLSSPILQLTTSITFGKPFDDPCCSNFFICNKGK